MIRLIIADDDAKVRSAVKLLLGQDEACWQVIAEVRNVKELLAEVRKRKPQLLLLDWELPEESIGGQRPPYYDLKDRIEHLRKLNPDMFILVLSSEPLVKNSALKSGANAFVSKGDPPEVFMETLNSICNCLPQL